MSELEVLQVKQILQEVARDSQQFLRALMIDSVPNLVTMACSLLLPFPKLWHNIRNCKQKKNRIKLLLLPPNSRIGYMLPDACKFLEKVENLNRIWLD